MTVDKTDRIYGIREYVKELFDPQDETNQETHKLTLVLGKRWAKVWLDEFRNTGKGKNTYKYLSSADGEWSAAKVSEDAIERFSGGLEATDNVSEKALGMKTGAIQQNSMISFENASAISLAKFNKDLELDNEDESKHGYLEEISDELQVALLALSVNTVPTVRKEEQYKIEKQGEYRRIKREAEIAMREEKATKEYEDCLHHLLLYKSGYRWKSKQQAKKEFHKLPNKTQKLKAVKLQINMRRLGCGWEKLYPKWTDKGHVKTPEELFEHLCDKVIPYDRDHQHDVPDKPKVKLPKKQDSNIQLGTATHQALALKESDFGKRSYIKKSVKNRFNVDDLHSKAPLTPPTIHKGSRIVFQFEMIEEDGSSYKKCYTGRVTKVCPEEEGYHQIKWDDKNEDDSYLQLLECKYNKPDLVGSWWIDIDTSIVDVEQDDDDVSGSGGNESVSSDKMQGIENEDDQEVFGSEEES